MAVVAGALAASGSASAQTRGDAFDVAVVGAGVFGAWTAWRLREAGRKVLLLDAWGPAHARSSSGGESRLTRTMYGGDPLYTGWAAQSLEPWRWLSAQAETPVFHPCGALFFYRQPGEDIDQALKLHQELKLRLDVLQPAELRRRYPQADWSDVQLGLLEPGLGALMARRSVQVLVKLFLAAGGDYRQARVEPPAPGAPLTTLRLAGGETVRAEQFVFACGPWLPKMFPDVLDQRIRPTRQEVMFFAPPAGDTRFGPVSLPGWSDENEPHGYYGFPDLEGRGLKIAIDAHGPPMDPDTGDRELDPAVLAEARGYLARRFPAMAGAPLSEHRVCQYENSLGGDLLIDRHPAWPNALLVGAGSGHGFKHGPAVGRYAADLVLGRSRKVEPRLSLAAKATFPAAS